MQTEGVQDLVRQESRPRHVARVLEDRDGEEEEHDERHEGEDAAHALDYAVDDERAQETRGDRPLRAFRQQREEAVEQGGRILAQREGQLEYGPDDEEENRQAEDAVHQDAVDALGQRHAADGRLLDRLPDRAADVAVALFGDDDLRFPAEMLGQPVPVRRRLLGYFRSPRVRSQLFAGVRIVLQQLDRQPARGIAVGEGFVRGDRLRQRPEPRFDLGAVVRHFQRRGLDPAAGGVLRSLGASPGRFGFGRRHGGEYRLEKPLHTLAVRPDRFDQGYAQSLREEGGIDAQAFGLGLVRHVERADHRDAQLLELQAEVEIPLQVGRIDHVDDDVRPLLQEEIARHDLVQRIGGQAVDARQVDDPEARVAEVVDSLALLHGDAGIVPHLVMGAGDGVEEACLARIRVARQGDADRPHADRPRPPLWRSSQQSCGANSERMPNPRPRFGR